MARSQKDDEQQSVEQDAKEQPEAQQDVSDDMSSHPIFRGGEPAVDPFIPPTYTVRDWYWIVKGDEGKLFSSTKGKFIPAGNPDYKEWLDAGNRPSRIASCAELYDVLSAQAPELLADANKALSASGDLEPQQEFAIEITNGVTVKSTSDHNLTGPFDVQGPVWDQMTNETLYIRAFDSFSAGQTSVTFTTADDKKYTFTDKNVLMDVVRKLHDWLSMWNLFITGQADQPPKQPVQVA